MFFFHELGISENWNSKLLLHASCSVEQEEDVCCCCFLMREKRKRQMSNLASLPSASLAEAIKLDLDLSPNAQLKLALSSHNSDSHTPSERQQQEGADGVLDPITLALKYDVISDENNLCSVVEHDNGDDDGTFQLVRTLAVDEVQNIQLDAKRKARMFLQLFGEQQRELEQARRRIDELKAENARLIETSITPLKQSSAAEDHPLGLDALEWQRKFFYARQQLQKMAKEQLAIISERDELRARVQELSEIVDNMLTKRQ